MRMLYCPRLWKIASGCIVRGRLKFLDPVRHLAVAGDPLGGGQLLKLLEECEVVASGCARFGFFLSIHRSTFFCDYASSAFSLVPGSAANFFRKLPTLS